MTMPSLNRSTYRALGALAVLLAGCSDGAVLAPTSPQFRATAANLSLADATTGGDSHLFFLPPLVDNPKVGPENDASLLPDLRVDVCVLEGERCASDSPVASFLPGGRDDALRLTGNHYQATWRTQKGTDASVDYRVTVFAWNVELGHADVDVVDGKTRKLARAGFVAVKAGEPLLIPFRVRPGVVRSTVASISLSPSPTASVATGGSTSLTLSAFDASGAPVTTAVSPAWSSSDPSRVTVSVSASSPLVATITGVSPGTATVTASVPGTALSKMVTVTVMAPPVQVQAGTPSQLDAATLLGPGVPLTSLTWNSSDPSVFSVSPTGLVTPLDVGSATISVVSHTPAGDLSGAVALASQLPPWCTIRRDLSILPKPFQVLVAGSPSVALSAAMPDGAPVGTDLLWSSGVSNPVNQPFTLSSGGVLTAVQAGYGTVNVAIPGTLTYGTGCGVVLGAYVAPGATPSRLRLNGVPSSLVISATGVAQAAGVTVDVLDGSGNVIAGDYPFQWASGNPAVLTVAGSGSSATLSAVSAGVASLSVSVVLPGGNLSTSATVSVVDQRPPAPGPGTVTIAASRAGTLSTGDTMQLTATVSGAQPNPADIVWSSTSPSWLEIVGPVTGTTITVRNTGAVPRATSVQVNANVTTNAQVASGSILVPIAP